MAKILNVLNYSKCLISLNIIFLHKDLPIFKRTKVSDPLPLTFPVACSGESTDGGQRISVFIRNVDYNLY